MQIENEATLKATLKREFNLFVGAGFSVLARDEKNRPLPVGNALVAELCDVFNEPGLATQNLPLVSQILKTKDRARFNDYLIERFSVGNFDDRYKSICALKLTRIFTTNIDNLFPKIFNGNAEKYLNDLISQGATFRDRAAVEYLPLHGCINYPEPDFTFTPIEIASAFSSNPTQFQYLVTCLSKSPTIFLGYSLQDAGALQSLNFYFSSSNVGKARWIQLREDDEAAKIYFRSLGFKIIISDTNEILDYLHEMSIAISEKPQQNLTQESFETGKIPSLNEAPVRPINDYFKGHAPVWHDILTHRVPTTTKYDTLVDKIDSDRHVLIGGIPVSGKSTLLMQAAAYYETDKVKLFEDVLTPEKANSICNKVRGRGKILMFLDNAADSVDALDILTSSSDIQLVAADRSVNIGFGAHRFNTSRFVRLDSSDLSDTDYPKIFEAIPPALRIERMSLPEIEAEFKPSTFEFIEKNVRGQSIADRYRDVLQQMRNNQPEIHDLFVMICYVFSCHAPVSFDVVSRFTGADGDYNKVYETIERLGRLLSEVDTADSQFIDLDENQDHFTPRSSVIAETVVNICRDSEFRRIYLQFHQRVPRLFIPRFSNFRRYGYRNAYAERVFEKWEDGERFYLNAYKEDKSYFLKQQLSIFLGGKHQYELAFKYIDEALTESRNRNPNIRHTHARLLFDANIEKAVTNSSLRIHLSKSMEILEGCHEYDKRQTNHALRFADQAIRFANVFPGKESKSYVNKAVGWIQEELEKTPSLRHAKYLLGQLTRL